MSNETKLQMLQFMVERLTYIIKLLNEITVLVTKRTNINYKYDDIQNILEQHIMHLWNECNLIINNSLFEDTNPFHIETQLLITGDYAYISPRSNHSKQIVKKKLMWFFTCISQGVIGKNVCIFEIINPLKEVIKLNLLPTDSLEYILQDDVIVLFRYGTTIDPNDTFSITLTSEQSIIFIYENDESIYATLKRIHIIPYEEDANKQLCIVQHMLENMSQYQAYLAGICNLVKTKGVLRIGDNGDNGYNSKIGNVIETETDMDTKKSLDKLTINHYSQKKKKKKKPKKKKKKKPEKNYEYKYDMEDTEDSVVVIENENEDDDIKIMDETKNDEKVYEKLVKISAHNVTVKDSDDKEKIINYKLLFSYICNLLRPFYNLYRKKTGLLDSFFSFINKYFIGLYLIYYVLKYKINNINNFLEIINFTNLF